MASQSLIRFRKIRKADVLEDKLTPDEIAAADSTSVTQEDLQNALLSQVRRIIWGDDFTKRWNDDFLSSGVATLEHLALGRFRACLCKATDTEGDLVYVTGPSIAGVQQVSRSTPSVESSMPVIGIIVDKPMSTACLVQTLGEVNLQALVPGRRYFVGDNGRPTPSPPQPQRNGYVMIQPIGVALDQNILSLTPGHGMLTKRIG